MRPLGITRRLFCGAGLAWASSLARAAEPPRDVVAEQDFDELWRTLGERYCFFSDKATDWQKVKTVYRPVAIAASTVEEFSAVVHFVLAELYDAHTHLSDPPDGTPRWPGDDLIVERAADAARVVAVAEGSAAARAGLRPGDLVLAVEDVRIAVVAAGLGPRCLSRPDPAAQRYAWNVAVAGRKGRPRRFSVRGESEKTPRSVTLPDVRAAREADLSSRRLDGGIGYVRIASFADAGTVAKFDAALAALRDSPGLIIDVRRNGGGDTAVARPIMGRFLHERRPYAQMRRRDGAGLGAAWTEYVDPRGPFTYTRPVVVLTDHWSGSMAEGFPMGMRGIGRARIVGTRMAGLGAAVFSLRLDRTGVQAQYSGEPVYDREGAGPEEVRGQCMDPTQQALQIQKELLPQRVRQALRAGYVEDAGQRAHRHRIGVRRALDPDEARGLQQVQRVLRVKRHLLGGEPGGEQVLP